MLVGSRSGQLLLLCLLFSFALPAQADPPPLERIPDVLEPWVPWVLEGAGSERCPKIGDVPTCVWPSQLELAADEHGATFTLRVTTDDKQQVVLPGSEEQWPEDVQVDGKPAAVLDGGTPYVMLERGAHAIKGRFSWREMPDSLAAPANLASLAAELLWWQADVMNHNHVDISISGARIGIGREDDLTWMGHAVRINFNVSGKSL